MLGLYLKKLPAKTVAIKMKKTNVIFNILQTFLFCHNAVTGLILN